MRSGNMLPKSPYYIKYQTKSTSQLIYSNKTPRNQTDNWDFHTMKAKNKLHTGCKPKLKIQ